MIPDHVRPVAHRGRVGIDGAVGGRRFRAVRLPQHPDLGRPHEVACKLAGPGEPEGMEIDPPRMLGLLDASPGPAAAQAARLTRLLVGTGPALSLLDGRGCWDHEDLVHYGDGRHGAARMERMAGTPGLALLSARAETGRYALHGLRPVTHDLKAALDAAYPAATFALPDIARVARGRIQPGSLASLAALASTPPEWLPRDPLGIMSFLDLAEDLADLALALGGYGFLGACRGRWARLSDTVSGGVGRTAYEVSLDALDVAESFRRQALSPAATLLGVPPPPAFDRSRPGPWGPAAALFGGKGLASIIEATDEWHRRREVLDVRIGDATATDAWPVPFTRVRAPGGTVIEFLADTGALSSEGASGSLDGMPGLNHCVAAHAPLCASGERVVASVRKSGFLGTRRLSTVEFDGDIPREVRIVQHRGRSNLPPPRRAARALEWFCREVASGRLVPDPAFVSARRAAPPRHACGYDPTDPALVGRALEAWSRWLPRHARDARALVDRHAALGASTAPRHVASLAFGRRRFPRPAGPEPVPSEHEAQGVFADVCHVLAWPGTVPFRHAVAWANAGLLRLGLPPGTGWTGTMAALASGTGPGPSGWLAYGCGCLAAGAGIAGVATSVRLLAGGAAGTATCLASLLACALLTFDRGDGPDRVVELASVLSGDRDRTDPARRVP